MKRTMRFKLASLIILIIISVLCTYGFRAMQYEAARMRAQGRLSQLHLALHNYETVHGFIPNRTICNESGVAIHSWLTPVLPHIEQDSIYAQIDLTAKWDSVENRPALTAGKDFWSWVKSDGFTISAYLGQRSIWDARSSHPVGLMKNSPRHIVLLAVPIDSVHPMEPFAVDDRQLLSILESGKEILYVDGERFHGSVQIHGDGLRFVRDAETRDRTKR